MRILQLGKFYPVKGGVEKVMYELTMGLSEAGIPCDMLCAHAEHGSHRMRLNGLAQIICSRTWIKLFATMIAPSMILTLRKECRGYDLIHIHCPDPMAAIALYFSGYKGKVVLHWHSDILKQKKLLLLYKPLQNWLIKRADRIICTTPIIKEESPFLKDVQAKVDVVPIGIKPMRASEKSIRTIREWFPKKKIIFSLGRLVEYKGFTYLISAAKYLPDDYVVVIGGEGPLAEELQAQVKREGLENKVRLVGFIADEQLKAIFGACDVFCISSILKTEAFGIVQIEAMSCGKPVVATNIGGSGVSWVNKPGQSGLNVEPCNPEQLAQAIQSVLSDPDRYASYCIGAVNRFNEYFTKEKMIRACMNIYRDLLHMAPEKSEEYSMQDMENVVYSTREGLKLRLVGDAHLIVDNNGENLDMAQVFELNKMAAWIWQLADSKESFTCHGLVEKICEVFDVEWEKAWHDVSGQLAYWLENGLIVEHPSKASESQVAL